MMELHQIVDAARSGTPWPVVNSRKMTSITCKTGILATSLDYIRYSNNVEMTTLCLRFVRLSDQKAYIETFNNEYLKGVRPMGNNPSVIEMWLQSCESTLDLSQDCVVTFRRSGEPVVFVLHEEVDSAAEQIAQLKREHAAELDSLREKYECPFLKCQDDERSEIEDGPCTKKFRVGTVFDEPDERCSW